MSVYLNGYMLNLTCSFVISIVNCFATQALMQTQKNVSEPQTAVASPDLGKWGGQNNDVITTTRRNGLSAYQAILLGVNGVSAVLQHPCSL